MTNQNFLNLLMINMEILSFDKIQLNHEWRGENVNSPYTRIYMITKGIGYLCYGTEKLQMKEGYVYVVPARLPFSYYCEDGFSKIFFHISLQQPNGYDVFDRFNRCLFFLDPEGVASIKRCFEADSVKKIMEIKAYLHTVVCRCMLHEDEIKLSRYSEKVKAIQKVIEKNVSVNLTVEKIAKQLFISPATVHKIFRVEMGIPIGKYIDDYIMFIAEYEVRQGNLSIREISEKLEFCDQFYFSRCFSKNFGMSPMQYRKAQNYNQ